MSRCGVPFGAPYTIAVPDARQRPRKNPRDLLVDGECILAACEGRIVTHTLFLFPESRGQTLEECHRVRAT